MATISEYYLKQNFAAPQIDIPADQPAIYKPFAKGDVISGMIYDNADPNVPAGLKIIITDDKKYALPADVLEFKQDVSIDGKPVAPRPTSIDNSEMKEGDMVFPEAIRTRLNAIKSTDIVGNIIKTSRSGANGLVAGAICGLAAALYFKKPVALTMVAGAVAGGYISYKISKYNTEQKVRTILQ